MYQCLSGYNILYEEPDISEKYQTVKPPHHILPPELQDKQGIGTCLDLSLLFAACLENIGLCPVVILTGNEKYTFSHAIIGCWIGSTPSSKAIIYDKVWIEREIENKNLIILEATGIALGANSKKEKLNYSQAKESAQKHINSVLHISLVDICALRPPYGLITPIDCSIEPEVANAYNHAEKLAIRKNLRAIETTFLFYYQHNNPIRSLFHTFQITIQRNSN